MEQPFLVAEGLHYQYGQKTFALHPISFQLNRGNILMVLGPSGSGKTTLLHILAGLTRADAGRIVMDNKPIHQLQPEQRGLSMVFQKSYLLPHLTVGQNVEVGLKLQGKPAAFRREKALMILEKIGMADFYSRPISSLSGGQEQRVALARSIIITPQLLLLDEPFSQLDLMLRKQMGEWLRVIRQTFNLTMIMVTHDRDEALMLGDQFLLMREGKLEMAGSLREVYYEPNSVWTAAFMGFDNVINGVKTGSSVSTVLGELPIHPRLRSMPDGQLVVVLRSEWLVIDVARADVEHLNAAKEAGSRGSSIAVGDESVVDAAIDIGSHVSSIEHASGAAGARAIGYVLEAKFTGSQMEIKLRVGEETLIVKQLGYHSYDSGSPLAVHCTQSEVWCLPKVVGE